MIAYLKGELLEADFNGCVIAAGGVGYLVQIPLSTFEKLPHPGETAELFIRTQVREDAIVLFGFASREERALFDLLVGVNMVGGKLALAVLGAMPVDAFCGAVGAGDVKMLSRIPGIGKRTAERLIVELRDKLGGIAPSSGAVPVSGAGPEVSANFADALAALEQLGFKADAAGKVLRGIMEKTPPVECTTEKLLMLAIAELNSGR